MIDPRPTRALRAFSGLFFAFPLLLAGCAADSPDLPASDLRVSFPAQAEQVLVGRGAFIPSAHGFSVVLADELQGWRGLTAELPENGEDAIALQLPGGGEVRVRELGAEGPAERVESAITYRRAHGTSFWTVAPGGVEEWLRLAPGAIGPSGLAASWSIEGASVREHDDAVEILDTAGLVRIRVTAPAAYAAGGRPIGAHLRVEGATIALYVDPTADEVLVDPLWTACSPMNTGRSSHASVKLADGRVLVAGGFNSVGGYMTSAEIYDPAINAWSATGSMIEARGRHTMSLLPNGQVLVVGGYVGTSTPTGVELYDPATGTFSSAGTLTPRLDHTATTLTDGRILIAGGNSGNTVLSDALVYDQATGVFTPTGPIAKPHQGHRATRLADGRVLITGNYSGLNITTEQMVADIYNPATNTWAKASTGFMKVGRYYHAAGLLPDGRVIIAGGSGTNNAYLSSAEVYNPATNTFTNVASMGTARSRASSTMLPDGTFLIAGGYSGAAVLATTQRYDGTTNTWVSAGSMLNSHHSAVSEMMNGNYFLVAGGTSGINAYSPLSDIYSPLGALGASCTTGSECGSGFCADGVCCNTDCAGGDTDCRACSVAAGGAQNGTCGWVTANVNACAPACTVIQRGTFGTVADSHIIAGSPAANFGASTLLSLGLSGTQRQDLLSFNVSSIDPAALVTSATLSLRAGSGAPYPVIRVHQVNAPWVENTVTWTNFAGAYAPEVLASTIYTAGTASFTADIASLAQGWVNGSAANYGVLLERNLDGVNSLYASETATLAYRPKLTVCTVAHP